MEGWVLTARLHQESRMSKLLEKMEGIARIHKRKPVEACREKLELSCRKCKTKYRDAEVRFVGMTCCMGQRCAMLWRESRAISMQCRRAQ